MKRIDIRGILVMLFVLALPVMGHASTVPQVVNFNFDWKWNLGECSDAEKVDFNDSQWKSLDLPYDYQLNMPWVEKAKPSRGFKQQSGAWFRKSFTPEDAWKSYTKILLDFEGLMYYGDVYLNGKKIASTEYGYCGFDCDVTKLLKYGQQNVLAVYTNTGVDGGSRWYTGGGINRDVRIILKDRRSLARHGIYVAPKAEGNGTWSVPVTCEFQGAIFNAKEKLSVVARILDSKGMVIAHSDTVNCPKVSRQSLAEVTIPAMLVNRPSLWDIDSPVLYTCEVSVFANGQEVDCETERFGFRTIEFGKDFGFKLNGRKVFLQGIANHVDFGGVGVAAYRTAIERQLRLLKSYGFNAVRCSHNPYPVAFYELCDELGLLVVDEFVDKWSTDGNCWGGRKPFLECWFPYMQEFVKRDRNHPSIIMWSLGNEMQHRENASGYETNDWGQTMYRILDVVCKRYDTTRPTTAAMFPARANGIRRNDKGFRLKENILPPEVSTICDVASFNYEYSDYRRYKEVDPNLVIFQSEASVNDLITPYLRMDKASTVGLCYWGAIEYWGESDGWPKKGWNYSFFDHTLKPYPRAYLLQSVFKDEPQVHIGVLESEQKSIVWNDVISGRAEMSHSYWRPNDGDHITLEVSSNCEEVELLQIVNGKKVSLGIKKNDFKDDKKQNKLMWKDLAWHPGKIVAVARNKGNVVAQHELTSPGKAVRIKATVENASQLKADGMDLVYIRLQAVDAQGIDVENFEGKISVEVSGEARLVALDNGDHFTNLRLDEPTTSLYRGGALVILRTTRKAGKIAFKAHLQDEQGNRVQTMKSISLAMKTSY